MNELAIAEPSNIIQKGDNIEIQAQTPQEMQQANGALIVWCDQKIKLVQAEYREMKAAAEHAKKNRWSWKPLASQAARSKKRADYYKKIKSALEQGFYIVPNFPVSVFALRSNKDAPLALFSTTHGCNYQPFAQKEQLCGTLPEGEGEYKNPFPLVHFENEVVTNDKGEKHRNWEHWAEEWRDVEFPISMAKPQIMEAVSRAMAMKIFDDFGVLPGHRKVDPIIVGRIKDPRGPSYGFKGVSFILFWYLDTAIL